MKNFRTLGHFLKICPPKYTIVRGEGGAPQIILLVGILIFCDLGPHTKFHDPRTTPSGRKVRVREEEEIRRILITTIVATTLAQRRAAHALRSDQLGIFVFSIDCQTGYRMYPCFGNCFVQSQ